VTAVSWDEDGWDEPEPAPASTVPAYYCEDPCCQPAVRKPGILARLLDALRRRPPI